jgi:phospholipid/cholesterol/gamma-HCH transport system permease protein
VSAIGTLGAPFLGSIRGLGGFVLRSAEHTGFGVLLLVRTFAALPHLSSPRRIRDIRGLLFSYATGALPVTIVVSVFTGMILALNGGITLKDFGQETFIGRIVAVSMIREMGPFMTALILAASIGSGIAAEIGTMKVSEEIDALEVMSISPLRFLVLPRLVALTLICPMMTVFAGLLGIWGGMVVSKSQLGVSFVAFQNDALESLTHKDLYTGLLKSVVFGVTIAVVGCTQGLVTSGGATGVGAATRRSVVVSFLLIIVLGYYMTWFFFNR